MDIHDLIAAALRGERPAAITLAAKHLNWPKAQVALLARGDAATHADLVAALKALPQAEVALPPPPRSLPPIVPAVVGQHEQRALDQLARCLDHDDAVGGAICADGHLGYAQPVGGVVAYREHISVSGVGFDIACGNLAVATDLRFKDIRGRLESIADAIAQTISFGVGRAQGGAIEHALFDDADSWRAAEAEDFRTPAQHQLGTVGGGNHYVDLFRETVPGMSEDEAPVWIGIHFGSRGLGHKLATRALKRAGGKEGIDVAPTLLHQDSHQGQTYLAGMELAGRYAYAGRAWVALRVLDLLGAAETDRVHNHHNFAWREEVAGAPAWVVRKGCTPAFPGQRGFVGGSMGDDAVILEGVAGEEAVSLLHSTVHGAGRTFGRNEAKRRFTRAEMDAWVAARGVVLRGGDIDESPMAYRRLPDVLAEHQGSIRVLHTLRPVVVAMAGAGVVDPFKD